MRRGRRLALFGPALVVLVWACGGAPANAPRTMASADTTTAEKPPADKPAAGPPKAVDCGDFTSCALSTEGDVHCWGREKSSPPLGSKATSLALAAQFGCALLENKKVKCWGTGRIANDGKPYTNAKPTDVSGVSDVEELVANGAIACARSAARITCWGGEPKISAVPKGAFTQLAAGFTHACAVDKTGAISCWGGGDWGAGGPFAKAPAGVSGVAFLALGDRHACAIGKDKKVKCWGSNDAGQLGIKADIETHKKPIDVIGVTGAVRLVAGEASTCALLGSGDVKCWGANNEGELGIGKQSSDERPSSVTALGGVASLCLGSTHGCAVMSGAKLVCWGGNAHGELGDGSKDRKLTPTNVKW